MLRTLQKEGFASLLEVVISSIIFVIAAFGILTTISMLRPHGTASVERLEAAYIGKQVIDELRAQVDSRMWNNANSLLAPGTHVRTIGNYTVTYSVSNIPGLNVRELTMNITF
jgi:Tfp pilus assembly protein PilV